MSARETHVCPSCHAQSYKYWHGVGPGIIGALVKVKQAVIAKGENSIHTRKDMDGKPFELTKGEYANFTMLRYHGLVAHDKEAGKGYWLLTRRGNQFLRGEISIPQKVQVLNNHVIDHSDVFVTVEEAYGSRPWFEDIDTIEREPVALDMAQTELAL